MYRLSILCPDLLALASASAALAEVHGITVEPTAAPKPPTSQNGIYVWSATTPKEANNLNALDPIKSIGQTQIDKSIDFTALTRSIGLDPAKRRLGPLCHRNHPYGGVQYSLYYIREGHRKGCIECSRFRDRLRRDRLSAAKEAA
jgi:hypothetical protein